MLANDNTNMKSFGGCDMTVHMAGKQCGTLQAITLSITREVLPKYTMGNENMRSVTKGKRGIAGTLVFTNFDKHYMLREHFANSDGTAGIYNTTLGAINDVIKNLNVDSQFANSKNAILNMNNAFGSIPATEITKVIDGAAGQSLYAEVNEVYEMVRARKLLYADQIPEFDITLTMVNEYGNAAWMSVNGITLINEGYGFTMDDLSSETAYTFIARSVTPLTAIAANKISVTNLSSNSSRLI